MTLQPMTTDFLLDAARAAAAAGAAAIRDGERRRGSLVWREKSATDFVSDVDMTAEARIIEVLRAHVPDAAILAEETAAALPAAARARGVTFVIDPLDGTTNFLHGVHDYAVSIAALVDDELAAGVVVHVPRDDWYTATRGGGAWLNGTRLAVSTIDVPDRALIATGFPYKGGHDIEGYLGQMRRLMTNTAGIRRPGAASLDLAGVACGRFEGFWENILAPWDIAAGILLVREAGGIVTTLSGAPCPVDHTAILASTPAMHGWLLERLKEVD
ncbi:MAG: inositol monophosphatase family protein [Gemmatimonadota bacterium]|nr:inositol monophosphatase family protein [Gemmatimonadota bacterium]